jgi:hypothetical protein
MDGKLEEEKPKGAFKLGFLLLGVFPTDILTSIAVGGSLRRTMTPCSQCCRSCR